MCSKGDDERGLQERLRATFLPSCLLRARGSSSSPLFFREIVLLFFWGHRPAMTTKDGGGGIELLQCEKEDGPN